MSSFGIGAWPPQQLCESLLFQFYRWWILNYCYWKACAKSHNKWQSPDSNWGPSGSNIYIYYYSMKHLPSKQSSLISHIVLVFVLWVHFFIFLNSLNVLSFKGHFRFIYWFIDQMSSQHLLCNRCCFMWGQWKHQLIKLKNYCYGGTYRQEIDLDK